MVVLLIFVDMVEYCACGGTSQAFKGQQLSVNYFRGSRLIDAIWYTKDVVIENACALLFGYGIENHSAFGGYQPSANSSPQK